MMKTSTIIWAAAGLALLGAAAYYVKLKGKTPGGRAGGDQLSSVPPTKVGSSRPS